MEADFLARLRADSGVAAAAGTIVLGAGTRPAVDWIERKSDDLSAFPALVLQIISEVGFYDQDGPSGLEMPRIRLSAFAPTQMAARALLRAGRKCIEPAATVGTTRFHRAKLLLGRDLPPEDLDGGLKIHRTVGDFAVPATSTGE